MRRNGSNRKSIFALAITFTLISCGGQEPKPYGYLDPSPKFYNLQEAIAGVGKPCQTGAECAGGLVCTNYLSVEISECEWHAFSNCPPGLTPIHSMSAAPGGPMQEAGGWFCMRACSTGADCTNGQCCLGIKTVQPWCVYDWQPRWNVSLLCETVIQ